MLRNDEEIELLKTLRLRHGHVSWERVVSGPGLATLYRFERVLSGLPEPEWLKRDIAASGDPAPVVSRAALDETDPVCQRTMHRFVSLYGGEAGNLALKTLATGGVYVGGGIAPKILPLLRDGFFTAFAAKGRFGPLLARIPIRVVLNDSCAILGAARAAARAAATASQTRRGDAVTDHGTDRDPPSPPPLRDRAALPAGHRRALRPPLPARARGQADRPPPLPRRPRGGPGPSGKTNVQGEEQQKLDALANDIFLEAFAYGQLVPTVVTEEMDLPARLPENEAVAASAGKYVVFVDPLDGSSNLDINGAVGSIFSVRRIGGSGPIHSEAELLARISQEQVVAGYFVYGPATMLVYTAGPKAGVQGFTLDPGIGEFLLSHPGIRIPRRGPYYACNEGLLGFVARGAAPVRRGAPHARPRARPSPLHALLGGPRRRRPPDPPARRRLPLPRDGRRAGRQAPAHVRGGPARGRRRGGRRPGHRRAETDRLHLPGAEPPADAALHRQPRGRRGAGEGDRRRPCRLRGHALPRPPPRAALPIPPRRP